MSERPYFSIVIPTLNEEKYLPRLLEDLVNQSFTDFEVLHIDGNSEDGTVTVASNFADSLDLQTKVVTKRNVSYQRNQGAKLARGKWILFMDADNQLPPHFLDGIKYAIAKYKDFDVFTTWMDTISQKTRDQSVVRLINVGLEIYYKILKKPSAFGAMIGAKKEVLSTVKFDEQQRVLEDSLFVNQAIDHNFTFRVLKEPRFFYSMRRLETEGTLKMVSTAAKTNFQYLQGGDFTNSDFGYLMEGGSYYDEKNPAFFNKIQEFFQQASQKQLNQVKNLIDTIKDDLG